MDVIKDFPIYVAKKIKHETVDDLIRQFKGLQANCYDLMINRVVIPRDKKLKEIEKDGNADWRFHEREVKFIVRTENGSSISVEFGLCKTIKSLKDYLYDVKKVSIDQRQMTFNGQELNDEMILNDCEIINDSVVCMNKKNGMSIDIDINNVIEKFDENTIVSDVIKFRKPSNAENYDLVIDGKIVPRNMTLQEANISQQSKLKFQERNITFRVRLCNGSRIRVDMPPSKSILNLKEHLNTVEKFPVCQQRISFNGKDLTDDLTLHDCGIKDDSDVYLLGRLYGG
ncbi:uncharacterized protein [Chironomus tepperi]|uniref:uncharacterized protein n=1 Tax=Chironomus tepperi TaxID=113505 RepID=UPI00391F0BCE